MGAGALDPWADDDVPPGAPAAAGPRGRVDVDLELVEIPPDDLARAIRRSVARALSEDLGDRGDVTSLATVPAGMTGTAELVARAAGVVAGTEVVRAVFEQVDARVVVHLDVSDGDHVTAGQVLGTLSGPLRSILTGERTLLNFLGHLSGIATRTAAFVAAVAGTGCAVRDTRKTTPGLRLLEKAAVRAGGGYSHRLGLHDVILVKDNHIAAAGGLGPAVAGALAREGVHVQVEVTDLGQLDEVLALGVTDVLLDNFTPEQVRQAVQRADRRAALEASGTITLETVGDYAATGVGRVAVGAITHSAPNLDIALDVRAEDLETPTYLSSVWSDDEVGGEDWLRPPDTGTASAEPEEAAPDGTDPAPALPRDEDLEGPSASPAFVDAGSDDPDAASESGLFAWRERQLGGQQDRD
ncbi:MAG: carboxylating nicotinate-nucleotide diphosphorylase [Actinobacteria bacterium]|nr:carboxylating nicotinate-nucleotide diphosphorylase [Actinomycetota bacterium]